MVPRGCAYRWISTRVCLTSRARAHRPGPKAIKRWFLLCTKTYNYGLKIKQAIEQDILLKSGKM